MYSQAQTAYRDMPDHARLAFVNYIKQDSSRQLPAVVTELLLKKREVAQLHAKSGGAPLKYQASFTSNTM